MISAEINRKKAEENRLRKLLEPFSEDRIFYAIDKAVEEGKDFVKIRSENFFMLDNNEIEQILNLPIMTELKENGYHIDYLRLSSPAAIILTIDWSY